MFHFKDDQRDSSFGHLFCLTSFFLAFLFYLAFSFLSFLSDDELGLHFVSSFLVVQLAIKSQFPACRGVVSLQPEHWMLLQCLQQPSHGLCFVLAFKLRALAPDMLKHIMEISTRVFRAPVTMRFVFMKVSLVLKTIEV